MFAISINRLVKQKTLKFVYKKYNIKKETFSIGIIN